MGEFTPVLVVFILFVGLPWLVLHYVTRMRQTSRLSADDERMLEDLWRSAREITRRLETVEKILEIKPDPERTTHNDR